MVHGFSLPSHTSKSWYNSGLLIDIESLRKNLVGFLKQGTMDNYEGGSWSLN